MEEIKYKDNEIGCKEFVLNETDFKISPETTFEADPWVKGVWRVTNLSVKNLKKRYFIILYMAGYPDPFGRIRERNDFEDDEL